MSLLVFFNDIAGIVYTAVNFFLCNKYSSLCLIFLSKATQLVPFGGGGVGLSGDESPEGRSGLPEGAVGRERHPRVN